MRGHPLKATPLPGTPAIIKLYQQRATQRKRVFDSEDAKPEERRDPILTRRRNGIVKVKDETRLTDVSLPKGMPAKIRILRKICGLSQHQLKARTGFSRATIQSWERGSRAPTLESLKILAAAFGVSVGKLCDE